MYPAATRLVRDGSTARWLPYIAHALFLLLIATALLARESSADGAVPAAVGESIYRRGVVGSGAPLDGTREDGMHVRGTVAACISCHRRSGLGSREGLIAIPPITGRYLFSHLGAADDRDLPYVDTMRIKRRPYTDVTLAGAIREGIGADGKPLGYLMPRFSLDDADMAQLIAYLKQLDRPEAPGVTDATLQFATVITPDADPVKRRGMLEVLEHYFADQNALQMPPPPALRSSRKMMFMVHRRWQLHVWELSGPSDTWEAQLDQHMQAEPVLALVSGLGGSDWLPVHRFCEHQAVPCLFPNVEAPPADADRDFYSVYFSRGVLLEADLIAEKLLAGAQAAAPKSVTQVYRAGDSGEPAAHALAAALKAHGIAVRDRMLAAGPPGDGLAAALRQVRRSDALVLWLRPGDVAAIGADSAPPPVVYMSGLMGGLENSPLPAAWRPRTWLAYPFDLPERRRVRVDFPRGWFAIRRIPVVDEQVQTDTYLACGLLAETLSHMADTFVRDYLVERLQDTIEHRILTGYYPRLTLATDQRFASKGGYIVRFAQAQGVHLAADQGWITP